MHKTTPDTLTYPYSYHTIEIGSQFLDLTNSPTPQPFRRCIMTLVKTLVTFVAITLSVMLTGVAHAETTVINYKAQLPDIKFDTIIETHHITGKKVSLADFKKMASAWFANDVELNTARLCKKDRGSFANIVPYEYLLVYSIRKGEDTYFTEVNVSAKVAKGFVSSLDRREDPFCGVLTLEGESPVIAVMYKFSPPKVAAQ